MKSKFICRKIQCFNNPIYKIILFSILHCSIISFIAGGYPNLKKLHNGRYILLTSKGISFLDETLTYESNNISFVDNIFTGESIIEQFPKKDDGYIIAFFEKNIYIFSTNEILLSNTTLF